MSTAYERLAAQHEINPAAAATTLLSLSHLAENDPVALSELAEAARDPGRVLWGDTGRTLADLVLIEHLNEDGTAQIWPSLRGLYVAITEVGEFGAWLKLPAENGTAP